MYLLCAYNLGLIGNDTNSDLLQSFTTKEQVATPYHLLPEMQSS